MRAADIGDGGGYVRVRKRTQLVGTDTVFSEFMGAGRGKEKAGKEWEERR